MSRDTVLYVILIVGVISSICLINKYAEETGIDAAYYSVENKYSLTGENNGAL